MTVRKISIPHGSRVFILDDDDFRIQWFAERLRNFTFAAEAPDAIGILDSYPAFDFLFLDHDLGRFTGTEGDGLQVARYLASKGFTGKNTVIHSTNAAKALEMHEALRDAELLPWGRFEVEGR